MNVKILLISILLLTLLGIFGGKLGSSVVPESWGGGFFSSPIGHIENYLVIEMTGMVDKRSLFPKSRNNLI